MVYVNKVGIEWEMMIPQNSYSNLDRDDFSSYLPDVRDEDLPSSCFSFVYDGSIKNIPAGYESIELCSVPFVADNLHLLKERMRLFALFVEQSSEGFGKIYVNQTCGFHIHVSLTRPEFYDVLCTYKFVKEYQEACLTSAPEIVRSHFRTTNEKYARLYQSEEDFHKTITVAMYGTSEAQHHKRYMTINYSAYNKNKRRTIEFRSFASSQNPETLYEITKWVASFVEEYVQKNKDQHKTVFESVFREKKQQQTSLSIKPTVLFRNAETR